LALSFGAKSEVHRSRLPVTSFQFPEKRAWVCGDCGDCDCEIGFARKGWGDGDGCIAAIRDWFAAVILAV